MKLGQSLVAVTALFTLERGGRRTVLGIAAPRLNLITIPRTQYFQIFDCSYEEAAQKRQPGSQPELHPLVSFTHFLALQKYRQQGTVSVGEPTAGFPDLDARETSSLSYNLVSVDYNVSCRHPA